MSFNLKSTFLLACFFCSWLMGFCQSNEAGKKIRTKVDSNYIVNLPESIHARLYLSRKYTNLEISKENGKNKIKYEPNSTVNFGIGVTIKSFTLNLAYGFRFLNEEAGKGKTKYLDLQTHMYKPHLVIDVFAQLYSGMYLSNTKNLLPTFASDYYLRPDIRVQLFGTSILWVRNHEKFSYSAPFVQNEIQQKSAGSFLYGAKAGLLFSAADSNYLPYFANDILYGNFDSIRTMKSVQFGPNIGYAYSLILWKRFFLTASANISFLIGPVNYKVEGGEEVGQWQMNPALGSRLAAGYNSPKWYLGLTAVQDGILVKSTDDKALANVSAGNIRFIFVKRFKMSEKFKKRLDKLPF